MTMSRAPPGRHKNISKKQVWLSLLFSFQVWGTKQVFVLAGGWLYRSTEPFNMLTLSAFKKGLGQLEAYVGMDEGVAFQMDNKMYWDTQSTGSLWAIRGVGKKKPSSKFWVNRLPSGKVTLRNMIGMYLAPVEAKIDPTIFPIQLVQYSESPILTFEVFYRGNRVAFRAYNGLFLGRVYRGASTLEASLFFPEEHCFFRPLIGDLYPPAFSLLSLNLTGLSGANTTSHLVGQQKYVNTTEEPKKHTFTITWKLRTIDRTLWSRLWGLGIHSAFDFSIGAAKPILVYSQDNEHSPCVQRDISETLRQQVDVPPMCEACASLFVDNYVLAVLPFTAVIRKINPDGASVNLNENGAWMGLCYDNVRIEVKHKYLHK